jgi:prepilin-type N-terminal cleavage/methylation domain-containing protein
MARTANHLPARPPAPSTPPGAFTLVELLVVVAVVGILAAIAVPNLLEAQTRAKVAAAKSNLRVLAGGLEAYVVDRGAYPGARVRFPDDPSGLIADKQLNALTTPVAYVSASCFRDPFGQVVAQTYFPRKRDIGDFPILAPPNPQKSLLYYHYPSLAVRFANPSLELFAASAVSIGPDSRDSLAAYRPFPVVFAEKQFGAVAVDSPADTFYDPTNGTVSGGDIARFTSAASQHSDP